MKRIFKRIVALTIVLCTLATMMIPGVYAEEDKNLFIDFATVFKNADIENGKSLASTFSQLKAVYDINKWTVYCDETGNYVRPNNLYAGGRNRLGTLEVRNNKVETYGAVATLPSVFIAPGTGLYQLSVDYVTVSSTDQKGAELGAYILQKPEVPYTRYSIPGPDAAEILTKAAELNPGDSGPVYGDNIVFLEEGIEYVLVFYVIAADMTPAFANFKGFYLEQVEMEPEYTTEGTELPTENDWPTAPPVIIEPTEPVMPTLPAEPVEPENYLTWEIVDGQAIITDCDTAISGDLIIPSTLGGYPVTGIGSDAFYECTKLNKVVIPDGVTSIDRLAFRYCSITSVVIPASVTHIGDRVFTYCSRLTGIWVDENNENYCSDSFGALLNKNKTILIQVPAAILDGYTIPNSVTSINTYAFNNCRYLTNITIPNSVTDIGDYAFYYCKGLTSVEIPDSVTTIGSFAFTGCSGLTGIAIPASVTSIGASAFYNCTSLTSIAIPDSVTGINVSTFRDCTSLTSIEIPASVTSIGKYAFSGCSSLTDVYYAGTQAQWGKVTIGAENEALTNAMIHTTQPELPVEPTEPVVEPTEPDAPYINYLTWEIVDGEAIITGCDTAISGDLIIPDMLDGYPVTGIGEYAFNDCGNLTEITIPDSVTSIGDYAFYYCAGLESIAIPEGVTSIGFCTFYCCSSLKTVEIPSTVTSIGIVAFSVCDNLTDVYYSGSQKQWAAITVNAGNDALTNATIHFAVEDPEENVWEQYLTWEIVDGQATITGCDTSISGDLVIPDTLDGYPVTAIGDYAFPGCTGLTSVIIPDSVTRIGYYAFLSCTGLTSITIPQNVTIIEQGALEDCTSMTAIWVDEDNAYYSSDSYGILFNKEKTVLVKAPAGFVGAYTIPDGVTTVGVWAFMGCKNLTEITIADSVTEISYAVFTSCTSLTSAYIGNGLTTISNSLFSDCTSLTTVTMSEKITYIGVFAFSGCTSLIDVYYAGTEAQKGKIVIEESNEALTNANWICKEAEVPEEPVVEELLFTVENKTVVKNREFTVTVEVTKNPGFAYLEVTPLLPAEFTLVKVENGELVSDFTSGRQYIWVADEDVTQEGLLLTFTFLVDDSVASGSYQIGFLLRSSANYAEKLLSLGVVGGEIQVIDVVYGDATGDGKVDGLDVLRLKKYLADYDYDTESSTVAISHGADVNGDGVIDGLDVLRLKKYLAEYNYETGESPIVLGPQ